MDTFPEIHPLGKGGIAAWFARPDVPADVLAHCLVNDLVETRPGPGGETTPIDHLIRRCLSDYPGASAENDWPPSLDQPWPNIARWNLEAILALLVARTEDRGEVMRAMDCAVRTGWPRIAAQCLEHRCAPSGSELGEHTAPGESIGRKPQPWLHCVVQKLDAKVLATLSRHPGIDTNVRDANGRTALFFASSVEQARILIEAGCDPEAVDGNGCNAATAWAGQKIKASELEAMFQFLHESGGTKGPRFDILTRLQEQDIKALDDDTVMAMAQEKIERKPGKAGRRSVAFGVAAAFALDCLAKMGTNSYMASIEALRIRQMAQRFPMEVFDHESIPGIKDGEILLVAGRCMKQIGGTGLEYGKDPMDSLAGRMGVSKRENPAREIHILDAISGFSVPGPLRVGAKELLKKFWERPNLLPVAVEALAIPALSLHLAKFLGEKVHEEWGGGPPALKTDLEPITKNVEARNRFEAAMAAAPDTAGRFVGLLLGGYMQARTKSVAARSGYSGYKDVYLTAIARQWRESHAEWGQHVAEASRAVRLDRAGARKTLPELVALMDEWTLAATIPCNSQAPPPRARM